MLNLKLRTYLAAYLRKFTALHTTLLMVCTGVLSGLTAFWWLAYLMQMMPSISALKGVQISSLQVMHVITVSYCANYDTDISLLLS
jgi:hypothetical protein